MRQALCLLFTVFLIAGILSGCSGGGTKPEDKTAPAAQTETQTAVPETTYEPPKFDFNGYEFTLLNGNTSYANNVICVEELTGETINDAFRTRNGKTEERYNIKLNEIISRSPQADYQNSVTAGDDAFDLGLLRMEWAMPAVLSNQAVPWNGVPNLRLDADYWVQGSLTGMSLMNNVYFAVSAFDITHYDSVRAFCFNKNMAADFKMKSPYELVREGKWTLDVFHDTAMAVASDLNANGEWDAEDRFGLVAYSNVLNNTLACGVGSILSIGKDKDDVPFFDLDTELHVNRLLAISKLMEERQHGLVLSKQDQNIFRAGRALYLNCLINEVTKFRDMDDDFGIIPAPKYDEAQENYINLGGSPFFMVIPVTAKELARTGAVMDALAFDSVGVIDTAYYDVLLKGKTSRDETSEEMLDLIFSTLEYYHPLANSYLNAPLADNYLWNASTDLASYFASVRPAIEKEIADAMALYKANVK